MRLMSPRHAAYTMVALVFLLSAPLARAQDSTLVPGGGGFLLEETPPCVWYLYKPFPMWSYMVVQTEGLGRIFGTQATTDYETFHIGSMYLSTAYLPSQTLTCRATTVQTQVGSVQAPYGFEYNIEHSNPSCNGHARIQALQRSSVTYWLSDDLHATSLAMVNGFPSATTYWNSIAADVNYSELQVSEVGPGADVGVYPSYSLPPTVPGEYDISLQVITLNANFVGYTADNWAVIGSHEIGHALGFGHSDSSDQSKTLMMETFPGTPVGLARSPLEQCAVVQAFPVSIGQ